MQTTRTWREKEAILARIEKLDPSEAKMCLLMAFEWMAGGGISTSQELDDWLTDALEDQDKVETKA